jgi:putative two-component system response regulator
MADSKKKILIVDDDESLRKSAAITLQVKGYDVLEAEDGMMGLDMTQAHHPQLVITDVYMPGMNGFMLAESIRSDEALKDTKIILMTSAAQAAGAWKSEQDVTYLDKGFSLPDLVDLVTKILG